MALSVKGCSGTTYSFEGPYSDTSKLLDNSGVYFLTCFDGKSYFPIDVGESKNVKSRIDTHDREKCWNKNCDHQLMVAVYYTPNKQQSGRMEVEQDIRCKYKLPCGDR